MDIDPEEQQRQLYNKQQVMKLRQILGRFHADKQHVITSVEGKLGRVEMVALGGSELVEEIGPIAEKGMIRLQVLFGGRLADALPGLKIYFVDGVIDGGGEAIPQANSVILDAKKAQMTLQRVETMGFSDGSLRKGDWTKLAGSGTAYGEITIVHETAHVLAAKIYGDEDAAFAGRVNPQKAPTLYGNSRPREDYAESATYLAYGQPLAEGREEIIQSDINRSLRLTKLRSLG